MPTCYRHPDRESYIRCQRCDRAICPDCMRDAAVGFQCPSCIAEGKKSTRSGRTAYGGLRPGNAGITSMVLIGINAAVWLLVMATGGSASVWIARLSLLPTGRCVPAGQPSQYFPQLHSEAVCTASAAREWIPGVSDGAYWQLLTSAFTHVEIWHIGFNMLALWVLGPQLELAIGRARFVALYLLSGLAGSVLVYWAAPVGGSTLGASGAIFGLMGALLVLAFKVRAQMQPVLTWIGINFLITVVGRGFISWQGHLGGFLGGLLIAAALVYAPRQRRTTWQVAGLTAVGVVLVVATLLRTAALA
ncbi:rhomboid family intramembrane serine protease [Nocardioides sp. LS1]|uniref:rhomboid family intramembrane serine protease n=1 Tax=Nocardioides sp. LS1 TaxID=1027620 RepID=UPI000FFA8306|nr:rhomboid family intramembrane serine protease [Nocardioides sp. LS1]GCD90194.1 rhomboid family intramembrane serine protease [Nocardioides sp. LS1]